ncbi:MAG TPA: FGGY family carbohydrate kinase [Trebonia sp.]
MPADLVAGIDIATAAVRVTVCDPAGTVVATAERALPAVRRPRPGWSEQHAAAWWPVTATALRQALSDTAGHGVVRAVSVAGTSGTVAAVSPDGSPLGPALMYDDRRAVREAETAQEAGRERWERMGITMTTSFSLPRIAWLAACYIGEPWLLAHVPDLIGWKLAGHRVPVDWSHALKSGYDVLDREWANEVFDALRIPRKVLPDVSPPTSAAGQVSAEAAALTGLPEGCAVRLGMTDGCAGQLAAGAAAPGQFATVLGTTLVVKGVTTTLVKDPQGSIYSHRHPAGWWLPGGASNTGGSALARWGSGRLAELDQAAAAHGPSTVISWPLRQQGERFPIVRPDAAGFAEGTPAGEADAYRADLEGVAYLERLCYERLAALGAHRHEPVITVGGGARSQVWSAIRATVLGDGIAIAAGASTSVGACLLAAGGTVHPDLATAVKTMVRPPRVVEPDPAVRGAMEDGYGRWLEALRHHGWLE